MVPDAEQLARIGGDQIGVLAACAAHGCEKPAVRVRSGLADLAVEGVLVLGSPDAAALRPGVSLDEARIAEERPYAEEAAKHSYTSRRSAVPGRIGLDVLDLSLAAEWRG